MLLLVIKIKVGKCNEKNVNSVCHERGTKKNLTIVYLPGERSCFFYERALITRQNMRCEDAQSNAEESGTAAKCVRMLGYFGAFDENIFTEFMFYLRALDFERKIHYCCKDNCFAKNDM